MKDAVLEQQQREIARLRALVVGQANGQASGQESNVQPFDTGPVVL